MFILIPLILILASIIGIGIIVYPKMQYVKKLTPESHEVGTTALHDFFPELTDWFNQVKFKEYQQHTLREIEKSLRRLRLAMLKVDHLSERLIRKIRRVHLSTHIEKTALIEKSAMPDSPAAGPMKSHAEIALDEMKAQEQNLIIEVAKNPKDFQLYEALGDLYLKMENNNDAKEAYEAALALNPSDPTLARKYSKLLHTIPVA